MLCTVHNISNRVWVTKARLTCDLNIFLLSSDVQNLSELILSVGLCADDEQSVQEVYWNAVGTTIVCAPDFGDASVCGCHQNWGHIILQGSIEEAEALYVQHVHLQVQTLQL